MMDGDIRSLIRSELKKQAVLPPIQLEWSGSILAGTTPGIIWSTMPADKTTWLHTTTSTLTGDATRLIDLAGRTFVRLFASMQVAGAAANTLIGVDYSLDNSSWTSLVTVTIANSTGAKDSGWTNVPSEARGVVYLRLYGQNGDGVASPQFSPVTLLIR